MRFAVEFGASIQMTDLAPGLPATYITAVRVPRGDATLATALASEIPNANVIDIDAITAEIAIPTVGIGASAGCDGQVLVLDDMLGLFADFKPKFVKRYATLAGTAEAAVQAYADEVRAGAFPSAEHIFAD